MSNGETACPFGQKIPLRRTHANAPTTQTRQHPMVATRMPAEAQKPHRQTNMETTNNDKQKHEEGNHEYTIPRENRTKAKRIKSTTQEKARTEHNGNKQKYKNLREALQIAEQHRNEKWKCKIQDFAQE